jgi:hypothetical protein
MKRLADFFLRPSVVWAIVLAATLLATLVKASFGAGAINNFLIFRSSFGLLIAGQNLYTPHPDLYFDLFKYSPAFALFMAPFAALPVVAGACAWNLLNAALLLVSLYRVAPSKRSSAVMAWIVFIDLVTSVQNFQSNALVAAFVVLTFCAFERGRTVQAAVWVVLAWTVKIYGAAVAMLFVVYTEKSKFATHCRIGFNRHFATWCLGLFVAMLCLPLLVASPEHLWWLYSQWWNLLRNDHTASHGLSVMGILALFIGNSFFLSVLQAFSMLVCGAPLLFKRLRHTLCRSSQQKTLWIASLLLWMVIWNHKAESPTYIIAITGVALWFVVSGVPVTLKRSLLWVAITLTSLSVTDIFPSVLREQVFEPLVVKAWPCITIWCIVQWELWNLPRSSANATQPILKA